ncbi:MAG: hypothetical protein RJA09_1954 [Pseudomonadota bacterium]|jgi:broad specificity phosphatase PhoE
MNKQPIESARDADLRFFQQAMDRAALRARELVRQTGTALVVSHEGVIELIRFDAGPAPASGTTSAG